MVRTDKGERKREEKEGKRKERRKRESQRAGGELYLFHHVRSHLFVYH